MTARMTARGRITIPKAVRDRLGLKPGDFIDFVVGRDTVRIRKRRTGGAFARFRGHLHNVAARDPDQLIAELRGE